MTRFASPFGADEFPARAQWDKLAVAAVGNGFHVSVVFFCGAPEFMQRILITGGAGFLGSHLADRLMADGNEVIVLDNFFTGRKNNIATHLANPRFELIRHDVIVPIELEVDQIYNLACPASPVHYQRDPVRTIQASVLGVTHMAEVAWRCKARILQASTSEIYGDPMVHPQPESYWGNVNTLGPRACYDEGKRVAETVLYEYHRQYGVEIRIPRIFNTYGPRMVFEDGRVVSNFILQALKNLPITIYGEGQQTRSFCYVDDLVEGLIRLMNHPQPGGPVNLGNPAEVTIGELAHEIIDITGSKSQLVNKPMPVDDPGRRCPDIGRARAVLGWEPKVARREGLQKTIADFETRLAAVPGSLTRGG
jgi:UDP-glucuronate decarboxylase